MRYPLRSLLAYTTLAAVVLGVAKILFRVVGQEAASLAMATVVTEAWLGGKAGEWLAVSRRPPHATYRKDTVALLAFGIIAGSVIGLPIGAMIAAQIGAQANATALPIAIVSSLAAAACAVTTYHRHRRVTRRDSSREA